MPHSTLTYIRLKAIAVCFRFLVWWSPSSIGTASPDETYEIESRSGGRKIKIHVYKSPTAHKPCPVLLNWHGSGFVLPMHGSDDLFCRRISQETDYTVLDASYALAPEYPFPAGLEDAEDAVLYVLDRPDEYDVKNIAVSGFSAGGNLALAVSSNPLSKILKGTIQSVIAFYPPCNLSVSPYDKKAPDGSVGTLPPAAANLFNQCYMPPEVDPADPRISVINAEVSNFPRNVLIVTAGKDNLAPEGDALAKKLDVKGERIVTLRHYDEMDHGFDKSKKEGSLEVEKRDKSYGLATKFLLTSEILPLPGGDEELNDSALV
jgi:acetyl esterase/lipase